jgi:hypothetical protein
MTDEGIGSHGCTEDGFCGDAVLPWGLDEENANDIRAYDIDTFERGGGECICPEPMTSPTGSSEPTIAPSVAPPAETSPQSIAVNPSVSESNLNVGTETTPLEKTGLSEDAGNVPNPYGRLGGPQHSGTITDIDRALKMDQRPYTNEFYVNGRDVNGREIRRFVDVAALDENGEPTTFYQVGRIGVRGDPVMREVRAFEDIQVIYPDVPIIYVPYNVE